MHRRTIRFGIRSLSAGVVLITVATFFAQDLSAILTLSSGTATKLLFYGFFWGSFLCGLGIVVAVVGLVRSAAAAKPVRLLPTFLFLGLVIGAFFILFAHSFHEESAPRLQPGETITI